MIQTCIHCGDKINTHCRCSETCYCGKPITKKITVVGTLDKALEYDMECSSSFGYQGMFHHERALTVSGKAVYFGTKRCYIAKKRVMYVIGELV